MARSNSKSEFAERINWPLWLWLFLGMMLGSIYLTFWAPFGHLTAGVISLIIALILVYSSRRSALETVVINDWLYVGNAKIEIKYIKTFQKIILSNIWLKENWFTKKNVIVRGGYFRLNKDKNLVTRRSNTFIYVGSVDEVKMGNLSIVKNLIETIPENIELYLCVLTSDDIYQFLINLIIVVLFQKLFFLNLF